MRNFGFPVSRTFRFLGFTTQIFQRHVVQIGPDGPRLLNLLDPELMPYTQINTSTFPAFDAALAAQAPAVGSPATTPRSSSSCVGTPWTSTPGSRCGSSRPSPTRWTWRRRFRAVVATRPSARLQSGAGRLGDEPRRSPIRTTPASSTSGSSGVILHYDAGLRLHPADPAGRLLQGDPDGTQPADRPQRAGERQPLLRPVRQLIAERRPPADLLPGTEMRFAFEPQ